MKFLLIISIIFLVTLNFGRSSIAEKSSAPSKYIDKGACPGEWCRYGTGITKRDSVLYEQPDKSSKIIGKLLANSKIAVFTGEVHTIPSKFIVKKEHVSIYAKQRYVLGDELWVYTYVGEGYFKVWYKGKMYEEILGFSPWGGSAGKRCEESLYCWGELVTELEWVWWLKISSKDGLVGWSNTPKNFEF